MTSGVLPFQIEVSNPCTESWETMAGGAHLRHCESCDKSVHNFAAMTPREIERSIIDSGGLLCARVTQCADGSLVTANPGVHPTGIGAGIALAAALSLSASANAQTGDAGQQAIVTGRVLPPEGGPIRTPYIISFWQYGTQSARTLTDGSGSWKIGLASGSYDLHIAGMAIGAYLEVEDVQLHAGQQTFGDLIPYVPYIDAVSGGISATVSPFYFLRHPIRYITYLRRRYL